MFNESNGPIDGQVFIDEDASFFELVVKASKLMKLRTEFNSSEQESLYKHVMKQWGITQKRIDDSIIIKEVSAELNKDPSQLNPRVEKKVVETWQKHKPPFYMFLPNFDDVLSHKTQKMDYKDGVYFG